MCAAAGLLLAAAPSQAQVKVERISKRLERVQTPTVEVEWRQVGGFDPTPVGEGSVLEVDDDLRTQDQDIVVQLTCGKASFRFPGPFRVIVLPPEDGKCLIHLLSGEAEVLGDGSSGVRSGEILAGALGTQYGVSVTRVRVRKGAEVESMMTRVVVVYEGKVSLSSGAESRALEAGSAWLTSDRATGRIEISRAMIERSADVYARLDLSAASLPAAQRRPALDTLRTRYQAVFRNWSDAGARLELAVSQVGYGVASPDVLYHLTKASGADTTAGERAAMVTWLRGATFQNLGNTALASDYFRRARALDPRVEQKIGQRYRIDPVKLEAIKVARPVTPP
jgi:hypothetical protein